MKNLTLITAPAAEPITLAELKTFIRVEHSDHDTFLNELITAGRKRYDAVEGILGRAIVSQTWDLKLHEFPNSTDIIYMPLPPLGSVTSVKYYDVDNALQTFASSNYSVFTSTPIGYIKLGVDKSWPGTYERDDAVEIRFVCGYADSGASPVDYADNVPEELKIAIKFYVQAIYDPASSGIDQAGLLKVADSLAQRYRVKWS